MTIWDRFEERSQAWAQVILVLLISIVACQRSEPGPAVSPAASGVSSNTTPKLHEEEQESIVIKCTIVADKSQQNGQRVLHFIVDDQKKTLQLMSENCDTDEISSIWVSGSCGEITQLLTSYVLHVRINRITGEIEATYHGFTWRPFKSDKTYRGTCQKVKAAIP